MFGAVLLDVSGATRIYIKGIISVDFLSPM